MQHEPKTILLATDATPVSSAALTAAAQLATAGACSLHVVYVRTSSVLPTATSDVVDAAMAQGVADSAAAALRRLGAAVAGVHSPHGHRAASILEVADAVGADLIVLGGRRLGLLDELFTHRVSEWVIHRTHLPVLLVPAGSAWPPQTVVVGCDVSQEAGRAAQLGAWIARLCGADVLLVSVAQSQDPPEANMAARVVASCAAEITSLGTAPVLTTRVVNGADVAKSLTAICASGEAAPLLAIGARGSGALGRTNHRSVSRAMSHRRRVPLLLAPPPTLEAMSTRGRAEAAQRA